MFFERHRVTHKDIFFMKEKMLCGLTSATETKSVRVSEVGLFNFSHIFVSLSDLV